METQEMSRRDFVKAAAGTAAAAALVAAGGVSLNAPKAVAATSNTIAVGDMVVGTEYTITANMYVDAKLNSIIHMNAYLTNLTTPKVFGDKPTTPVSDNATITKLNDGSYDIRITPLNNTFGLIGIAETSTDAEATVAKSDLGTYNWENVEGYTTRINDITFNVTTTNSTHVFTAKEYANFLVFAEKDWDVTLDIDFSSIK